MARHTIDDTAEPGGTDAEAGTVTPRSKPESLSGPSTNAATNLIIADIAMRGIGRAVRKSLHKGVLRTGYSRETAQDIVENRSVLGTLAIYGVTKIATRSAPGALLVGGGLLAKTLYDRGMSRRAAKRRSNEQPRTNPGTKPEEE